MRGLGNLIKGAVFIAGLLGLSAGAFAQQDPKVAATFDNTTVEGKKLDQVTLSRDGLVTYAAYDLTITNNTTNSLNRLYFTVNVANNGTDAATIEAIYLTPSPASGRFVCSGLNSATLSCTSGGSGDPAGAIGLIPGSGFTALKVTIAVKAPKTGTKLTTKWTAGGYEGNSLTGKGCCAFKGTVYTSLIDYTNDATNSYTLNAVTFVQGITGGTLFTGNRAVPLGADPFSTEVNAPPFTSAPFDIGLVAENVLTNCSGGNRFKNCYRTQVSLPLVSYLAPAPTENTCAATPTTPQVAKLLTIVLRIDSSLISGDPTQIDLNAINVKYTDNAGNITPSVPNCGSGSGFPCVCSRYQYTTGNVGVISPGALLPYSTDLQNDIEIVIKNTKNGFLEFD